MPSRPAVSLKVHQALFYNAHASKIIIVSVLLALAAGATTFAIEEDLAAKLAAGGAIRSQPRPGGCSG